jgi:hypothetical protein
MHKNNKKRATMKTIAQWLSTFSLLFASLAPAATPPANFSPPGGAWTGVYQPQGFTRMTFQLPNGWAAAGTTEIQFRLETLVQTRQIGMTGPMGVVPATVKFDAVSGAFTLVPAANARTILGTDVPTFTGVYDPARGIIGGKAVGRLDNPWFVLAPNAVAQRAFVSKLEGLAQGRTAGGVLGVIGSKFGAGGKNTDKLQAWAQHFVTEYPYVDVLHVPLAQIQAKTRNLFQDASFKPYFGKAFDELSPSDLNGYAQTIQSIPLPRGNFPEERPNGVLKVVENSFRSFPVPNPMMASGVTLSVLSMRAMDGWRNATLQRMTAAEPAVASWQLYLSAESTAKNLLGDDWPSRQAAFSASIAAARTRTASPLLESAVGEFLASNDAQDPAKVRDALATLESHPASTTELSLAALATHASADVRDAQVARMNSTLVKATQRQCVADQAAVGALPAGLPGLDALNSKYRSMNVLYSTLPGGASGCQAFTDLASARASLLASTESDLSARIGSAANRGEVTTIVSRYLSSPVDGGPAGTRLVALAEKRTADLLAAQEAALEKERQRIAALCGLNTEGLNYSTDVQLLCAGEFKNVSFGRDSAEATALASGYMNAFAQSCKAYLPANRVEITERACDGWLVTYQGGWEVDRSCNHWYDRGTGQYADPEVMTVVDQLNAQQEQALVGNLFGELAKALNNPLGYVASATRPYVAARQDMNRLLSLNGCASKPVKQLQKNLVDFGSGRR